MADLGVLTLQFFRPGDGRTDGAGVRVSELNWYVPS